MWWCTSTRRGPTPWPGPYGVIAVAPGGKPGEERAPPQAAQAADAMRGGAGRRPGGENVPTLLIVSPKVKVATAAF